MSSLNDAVLVKAFHMTLRSVIPAKRRLLAFAEHHEPRSGSGRHDWATRIGRLLRLSKNRVRFLG
jgi:hypothetical protein